MELYKEWSVKGLFPEIPVCAWANRPRRRKIVSWMSTRSAQIGSIFFPEVNQAGEKLKPLTQQFVNYPNHTCGAEHLLLKCRLCRVRTLNPRGDGDGMIKRARLNTRHGFKNRWLVSTSRKTTPKKNRKIDNGEWVKKGRGGCFSSCVTQKCPAPRSLNSGRQRAVWDVRLPEASAAWHMCSITVRFQTVLQDLWLHSLLERRIRPSWNWFISAP